MRDCSFPSTFYSAAAIAAAFAAALLLAACAGSVQVPAPTAKNVEYAGRNGQVTSLAALKVGRISRRPLFRLPFSQASESPGARRMAGMVERMAPDAKLNEDQQRAVTQYLVSVSAIAHDTASAAQSGTETPHSPKTGLIPLPGRAIQASHRVY